MFLFLGTLVMANTVLAMCLNEKHYECTATRKCDGVVQDTSEGCLILCTTSATRALLLPPLPLAWCDLYAINSKNMLGVGGNVITPDRFGCSVSFRGRSMTVTFSNIDEGAGCIDISKCRPCDGCCVVPPP